jgi:OmpA-OmpF porin, OOP family
MDHTFLRARLAGAALAALCAAPAAFAQAQGPVNDNWIAAGSGVPVRNGDQSLCWRNGFWTPATADLRCDGALRPVQVVQPVVVQPPPMVERRYTLQADTYFDFDSSRLKPEGWSALRELAGKVRDSDARVVFVLGFTDRIGTDAYNLRLSQRRADAVRSALVGYGVDPDLISAQGRGKSDPVVECGQRNERALIACLAPNRRVEIVVRASRAEPADVAPPQMPPPVPQPVPMQPAQ